MSKQLLSTSSQHGFSVSGFLDTAVNRASEAAFAWSPIPRLAEAAVVALMQRITRGQLRVLTYSHVYTFPAPAAPGQPSTNPLPDLKAELRVVSDSFWLRLCTMSDLGFAEAYMYGDVECDDLVSLFQMFLENRENLAGLNSRLSYLFTLPQKLTSYRFLNTLGNSRSNISAHYDISNDMFKGFLSPDMTYSCAIFSDLDGDLKPGHPDFKRWSGSGGLKRIPPPTLDSEDEQSFKGSLESTLASSATSEDGTVSDDELHAAQLRKLQHVLNKAHILPGHKVLEIGSGWGSMAMLIAQTVPGTTVDTLTLSSEQKALADARIRAASQAEIREATAAGKPLPTRTLSERINVHLMDYRSMPSEWENSFDRIVSIEMIEAVGAEFINKYWEIVDWALKKEGGAGVVQVITIPEPRYERYIREIDFIRKWIFPGGFLPTLTLLTNSITTGSKGRLIVDSVSNIGPHYARTLREWRRRFLDQFEDVIKPALQREYPDVMGGEGQRAREEIEVFKRKWLYYYCYCEVGFTTRTLGDHIIAFAREGYQGYGCNVYE